MQRRSTSNGSNPVAWQKPPGSLRFPGVQRDDAMDSLRYDGPLSASRPSGEDCGSGIGEDYRPRSPGRHLTGLRVSSSQGVILRRLFSPRSKKGLEMVRLAGRTDRSSVPTTYGQGSQPGSYPGPLPGNGVVMIHGYPYAQVCNSGRLIRATLVVRAAGLNTQLRRLAPQCDMQVKNGRPTKPSRRIDASSLETTPPGP